jgi:hypothetical protein
MAFTVNDIRDLTQLLTLHPEWRAEVRRLVLTDELLALPDLVRELAEAQKRTEQRVEELVEAQKRTELRVQELAQAQGRAEQRMDRLEGAMAELVQVQQRMWADLSRLKGQGLEHQYARKAASYLGRWLRRVRVVLPGALDAATESQLETRLTLDELQELLRLDVVIAGTTRPPAASREVWLAMEVSSVIDRDDVERARRRADLLRRAGFDAIPAVAGEQLTERAEAAAAEAPLVVLQDGRSTGWDEALAVPA